MLPRKKPRHNPVEAPANLEPQPQSQERSLARAKSASDEATHSNRPMPPTVPSSSNASTSSKTSTRHNQKQVRKAQSWYGSWPRPPKATASTSIARENIFGDNIKSQRRSDLARFDSRVSDEASSLRSKTNNAQDQDGGSHSIATAPVEETKDLLSYKHPGSVETQQNADSDAIANEPETPSGPHIKSTSPTTELSTSLQTLEQQRTPSGWLGWITRTPFTETLRVSQTAEETPIQETAATPSDEEREPAASVDSASAEQPQQSLEPRPSSWFYFWTANAQLSEEMKGDAKRDQPVNEDQGAKGDDDAVMEDARPPEDEQPPKAGSTWAFWSRDTSKGEKKTSQNEEGQIAVIGQGSESRPLPMTENGVSGEPTVDETKAKPAKSTWRRSKRARPASIDDTPSPSASGTSTPKPGANKTPDSDTVTESGKTNKGGSTTKTEIPESETPSKSAPNLLLPSFTSTYQMKENPSILQQISQLLLRTAQPQANHVFRLQTPPKIKKAIAIGVHGLLPATYLRPMIGQPTGTSLRFANLGADAIRRWTDSHGCSNCEIEKVALEGEGRISDRVENLWKLLLNWIDHIRKADLIVIACHSQGVPVSIMLLEKLIELGVITNAKIGVCAMAGVALGPFPDYKSSFLIGSAVELWDFGNPQSQNSQRFEAALKNVLDYGARITFVGSIDDQVVPMESAVYSPAAHPYIFRAVFIDGRVHAPDFISHLVGFALKLRNLGVSDHGLVRELSLALAGSLYSGEGHSRLYFEPAVYDLAISHALETSSVTKTTPCQIQHRPPATPTTTGAALPLASSNPYVLPWIMRGLLEEDFVKTELSSETEELLRQFDDWKPSNKALKDVKYRLEAVRSKL